MQQRTKCEVYSRCVGYITPVSQWNEGLAESFKDRLTFLVNDSKLMKEVN